MARKKKPVRAKIRTREHVIGDLAINHTERQVLLCGYTVERVVHDYGIDLILFTYNASGEVESGAVLLQVKATEKVHRLQSGASVTFRLERSDLMNWLDQLFPVILVVYDVSGDCAYWLHVQDYFQTLPGFNMFTVGRTVTVHLPTNQILQPAAIQQFARLRDQVMTNYRSI